MRLTVAEYNARRRARSAVVKAVRVGDLVRQPCEDCGLEPSQAHHPDYSQPLAVLWKCQDCHTAEHERLRSVADHRGWMAFHVANGRLDESVLVRYRAALERMPLKEGTA